VRAIPTAHGLLHSCACEHLRGRPAQYRTGRQGGAGADDALTPASPDASERVPRQRRDERSSSRAGVRLGVAETLGSCAKQERRRRSHCGHIHFDGYANPAGLPEVSGSSTPSASHNPCRRHSLRSWVRSSGRPIALGREQLTPRGPGRVVGLSSANEDRAAVVRYVRPV
jgi:hypothetical protein